MHTLSYIRFVHGFQILVLCTTAKTQYSGGHHFDHSGGVLRCLSLRGVHGGVRDYVRKIVADTRGQLTGHGLATTLSTPVADPVGHLAMGLTGQPAAKDRSLYK